MMHYVKHLRRLYSPGACCNDAEAGQSTGLTLVPALLQRCSPAAQTLREAAQRGAFASAGGERRPADTLGAVGQEILDAFEVIGAGQP